MTSNTKEGGVEMATGIPIDTTIGTIVAVNDRNRVMLSIPAGLDKEHRVVSVLNKQGIENEWIKADDKGTDIKITGKSLQEIVALVRQEFSIHK